MYDNLFIYDNILYFEMQIYFLLNAGRIWASTPQIADLSDYADFKRFFVSSGCYLSESGFTGLVDFPELLILWDYRRLPIWNRGEML